MKGADIKERNDSDKPIREVDNITAVDTMRPHKYSIEMVSRHQRGLQQPSKWLYFRRSLEYNQFTTDFQQISGVEYL